jgi:hypothetical protein
MFEDHVFTAFSAKTILFVTHIGPSPQTMEGNSFLGISMTTAPPMASNTNSHSHIHRITMALLKEEIAQLWRLSGVYYWMEIFLEDYGMKRLGQLASL